MLKIIRDENIQVCGILETHVKANKLNKVSDNAFGECDWVSNINHSSQGCRILVGWDRDKVDMMVMHMTSQVMLCLIILSTKVKVFCTFVYAKYTGRERRALW